MSSVSILFQMMALGAVLLVLGIGLVLKGFKPAGIVISLLGLVAMSVPLLTMLYIALSMR